MATLLLTRPEAQSRRLVETLARMGVRPETIVSPVVDIQVRDIAPPPDAELILTSQNALAAMPAGHWRAWCVGDRTAEAARAAGLEAVSAAGDVESLLRLLLEARPGPLVHVRGRHSAGSLVARLREAGVAADEIVAYDQVARPLSEEAARALGEKRAVVLPLYSPRSAALVAAHPGPWRAEVHAVAISEAAARAFGRRVHITVTEQPSGEAMEKAIVAALLRTDGARLVDGDGAS